MSYPPAAVEAHDPRVHIQENNDIAAPEHFVLDDGLAPNFETYLHYAEEQRDKEASKARREGHRPPTGWWSELFGLNRAVPDGASNVSTDEKKDGSVEVGVLAVTPAEYRAASSSLRTATWGTVFYLITTGAQHHFLYFHSSHERDRYPWSVFGALCVLRRRVWTWRCMLCRFRHHGSL